MPIVHIYYLEGRSQDQKEACMKKVTEAICETLIAPPENVRIVMHEKPLNEISVGGVTMEKLRKQQKKS
jgi:4-oxalocrotonate tautomerase